MDSQPDLLTVLTGGRDGDTFDAERDEVRLNRQAQAVFDCVKDGAWWSLPQLARATSYPEASISARLRDLRKWRFGAMTVERRYVADGLWEYRLTDLGRLSDA